MTTSASHESVLPGELLGISLPGPRSGAIAARDAGRLLSGLAKAVPDWALLGPHVRFDPRGYVRNRLFRDADWELLLLCWLPGQKTVVHDHGGAWGAVRILVGGLLERRYSWRGTGKPLAFDSERACDGAVVLPEPVETVHQNENVSALPAISLHLYSPPLSVLNSYDVATGERRAVKLLRGPSTAVGGNPRLKPGVARRAKRT